MRDILLKVGVYVFLDIRSKSIYSILQYPE